ncbi:MAG: BMP family lipoprotein, partial [Vulcanimicrobiaceae bacterium]
LAACGRGASSGPARLTLGMVTDVGGLGDKSFNDSAYRGLLRARAQLGAQIQVLESKSAADYQPNLSFLAEQRYDEIYAIGFLMSKDLAQVAEQHPSDHFAIVDAVVDEPNVTSITFREQESSFLAGALAAMVTKTHTIGFLGGVDLPLLRKFEAGYIAGAREIDPHVATVVKWVGSFEDVASGKELASVEYDAGVDVLFVAAGKSGLGALDETRARPGVYAIGVDSDQDGLVPGRVLTSVVKRVDVAVYRVAEDARERRWPTGRLEFGLRDHGVGLTDFRYTRTLIGAAHLARLARLRAAIVAGTIVPPQTLAQLAAFRPHTLAGR